VIRRSGPDEAETHFAIQRAACVAGLPHIYPPELYPFPDDEIRQRWREFTGVVLVAERDGAVAGWGSLGPWSSRGAYARTAEVSVYVDAAHRRRGVGRMLVAALVERGRAAGLGVLLARIAEANHASVALFESFGFGHIGTQRRCGEKFGRVLDVELMDLHLDGG